MSLYRFYLMNEVPDIVSENIESLSNDMLYILNNEDVSVAINSLILCQAKIVNTYCIPEKKLDMALLLSKSFLKNLELLININDN